MVREAGESREEVGHRVHLEALALEAWSAGENIAASGALGPPTAPVLSRPRAQASGGGNGLRRPCVSVAGSEPHTDCPVSEGIELLDAPKGSCPGCSLVPQLR